MPILGSEPDIYPEDLFQNDEILSDKARRWWCVYTMSRREKDLMRKLYRDKVAFYSPVIAKRYRSPSGRMRTSHIPLFHNYVFMFANDAERYQAMTSNCISKCTEIAQYDELIEDLQRIQLACQEGEALTPESRLEAGDRVRVRTGPFAGFEGTVVRREGKTRLLLSIRYLEKGVSMAMDEGVLDVL